MSTGADSSGDEFTTESDISVAQRHPSASRVWSLPMNQPRIRVAVVFGGRSTEHGVSCVSAGSVLRHLDRERYEVVPVGITAEGAWVLGSADQLAVTGRTMPEVDSGAELTLVNHNLIALEPARGGEALAQVDVVFPVLHGAYGEDGTIQGLLELADIPYVGPGVLASAVAMDKEYTKKLLLAEGLPVGPYAVVPRREKTLAQAERDRLGLPVFVKPARAGSSTGITKVTSWDDLDAAIESARAVDPKVFVEAAIVGREIECGVLEFPDGRVEASLPAEIRMISDTVDWYDFDSKYLDTDELRVRHPGQAGRRRHRPGCGRWPSGRSPRWTARAWPGSTSSSPRQPTGDQRAEHHARLHQRVSCTRRCGPSPASTTRPC